MRLFLSLNLNLVSLSILDSSTILRAIQFITIIKIMRVIITFLSLLLVSTTTVAAPMQGTFTATQECAAYQSKNKLTNPENINTKPQQQYQIHEYLGDSANPTWLRIKTTASHSAMRWVKAQCGTISGANLGTNNSSKKQQTANSDKGSCSTRGNYDSYVLAISWQPAFCELGGKRKTECRKLDDDSYGAGHFTLHGLWPNKRSCGIKYGFCGIVETKPKGFCGYPKVPLDNDIRQELNTVMPSAKYGTCLQRHEYWKHGSCDSRDANGYFAVSTALVQQVNQSTFVTQFIQGNIGDKVSRKDFEQAFDQSFGRQSHKRIRLQCRKDMLTEIQINLPKEIKDGTTPISDLLKRVNKSRQGNCPRYFKIDQA